MTWFQKSIFGAQSGRMIGYKIMRLENGRLISGANSRISLPAEIGVIHSMPGNGIYLGKSPEYVRGYYSSSESVGDPQEVLITYEFDPSQIMFGNLNDREWEIAVPSAKVLNIEKLTL